jgi:hypothetical protein
MAHKLKWFKYGDLQIALRDYDNKSRKGRHVIVKNEKGRRKIFKYTGLDPKSLTEYYKGFKGGIRNKKYGTRVPEGKTDSERYYNQVGKAPRIDSVIRKGKTSTEINNIKTLNIGNIKKTYKNLLGGLVLDDELLNIITDEGNVQKYKHRLSYSIELKGVEEDDKVEIKAFDRTILELKSQIDQISSPQGLIYGRNLRNLKGSTVGSLDSTQNYKITKITVKFIKGK